MQFTGLRALPGGLLLEPQRDRWTQDRVPRRWRPAVYNHRTGEIELARRRQDATGWIYYVDDLHSDSVPPRAACALCAQREAGGVSALRGELERDDKRGAGPGPSAPASRGSPKSCQTRFSAKSLQLRLTQRRALKMRVASWCCSQTAARTLPNLQLALPSRTGLMPSAKRS